MFETETDYNQIGSWGTKVMFKVETVDQAKHNLQEITKNWIIENFKIHFKLCLRPDLTFSFETAELDLTQS